MIIAIIGAGNIGGTLGVKWAQAGHTVRFGVRAPSGSKYGHLHAHGRVVPIAEALAGAEAVLLSLPGASVADFAAQFGESLAGTLAIDATNNMRAPEMNSLAVLKEKAPGARLVRAFSNLGWENFANPRLGGEQIDLFYCGHAGARPEADRLIGDIDLRPVYLGDLEAAPIVDATTRLWFTLAAGQGLGRRLAFKMLQEN
jgi:8-hydroxy-5-deazaflavin:NADPH oxidoreductase